MSNGMDLAEMERRLDFQEIQSLERGLEGNQNAYEGVFEHYIHSVGSKKEDYRALLEVIQENGNGLQNQLNDQEEK